MNQRMRFEIDQILSLLLASAFLFTGVAKVSSTGIVIETFGASGVPPSLLVAIGLLEIVAAVLVIIPTTRQLGGGLVSLLMVGAAFFHIVRGELLMLPLPITLLGAAVALVILERRGFGRLAPQTVVDR